MDVWLTLGITIAALALFVWNKLRVDVVGLLVMVTLILTGLVTPREGVSGFANEAMLTVAAMFVLSGGLVRTGAVDALGRAMGALAGSSELRLLAASMAVAIPLSAVMNNTPVVVIMVPVVLGLARRMQASPSHLLMPISFASQLGGTLTLVGTSTNLLVAGLALELGLPRVGLFDITGPGAALMVVGVLYLLTVGRALTPARKAGQDVLQSYELRQYLAVLAVPDPSPLAGRSLGELRFGSRSGLEVLSVERRGRQRMSPGPGTVLRTGDLLLVEGKAQDIARIQEEEGLELRVPGEEFEWPRGSHLHRPAAVAAAPVAAAAASGGREEEREGDPGRRRGRAERGAAAAESEGDGSSKQSSEPSTESGAAAPAEATREEPPETTETYEWAELIVPPRSRLTRRTLAQAALRERFGATVLGVLRHGTSLGPRLSQVRLAQGDLLLVQATPSDLMRIHEGHDLALLGALRIPARRTRKMGLAISILGGVIAISAIGVLPILVAALVGCCLMFLTGCLTPEEAYEDVDWMVLALLATILPLGIAMQQSGTARLIAEGLLSLIGPLGPWVVLFGFYLLTSLLTELISNNAAAVVLTPISIATAQGLGISPMPFLFAVMLAASNSYMTPIGYQTNTFVYGPGGYRFVDFVRVGGPLNLLLAIVATVVLPWFFPFSG